MSSVTTAERAEHYKREGFKMNEKGKELTDDERGEHIVLAHRKANKMLKERGLPQVSSISEDL